MVVVLGEALCDLFALDAEGAPTRSEQAHRFVRISGGAPANFAIGLARRGVKVSFITELGDDAMGRFLIASLQSEGIDTRGVHTSKREKTGVSFISVDARGERSFDFYRKPSSDMIIDEETVKPALPIRGELFHFGTNSLILPSGRAAVAAALKSARENGVRISCDLNVRAHNWASNDELIAQARWAIAQSDWLKISDEELALVGELSGPSLVALTEGEKGARIYQRGEVVAEGPSVAKRVVDTCGAGDAFYSAFVAVTLRGGSPKEALRAGHENAASVIAEVGAVPGLLRG